MTKAQVGMKVEGYHSHCVGLLIEAHRYLGTITKVNKKSIRVNITENINTFGKKETSLWQPNDTVIYTYWKTTSDGRELYRSEGRLYGIITL